MLWDRALVSGNQMIEGLSLDAKSLPVSQTGSVDSTWYTCHMELAANSLSAMAIMATVVECTTVTRRQAHAAAAAAA